MNSLTRMTWIALTMLLSPGAVSAQQAESGDNVLQWNWRVEPVKDGAGNEVDLVIEAQVRHGWIFYSSDFGPIEFGPKPAKIVLDKDSGLAALGAVRTEGTRRGKGTNMGKEYSYTYFADKAALRQRVRVTKETSSVKGLVTGQACFEESGLCTLVRQNFAVTIP